MCVHFWFDIVPQEEIALNRYKYRAFAVVAFFKNNESVIATQRAFRTHFRIPPNGDVIARGMGGREGWGRGPFLGYHV